jgi:hypothetical protein
MSNIQLIGNGREHRNVRAIFFLYIAILKKEKEEE